ncbi:PEGA domain-containing protein [Oceanispirochaeta sp.]|jgi:hypothetical protein|uniref:PEGA domain-containing protein n=1 Tax=Oceanispirochaeta sp. TaxID=2035350 RepID=UPI002601E8A0|nr:PEGA domain-containing protein [Oceanispirochaeta sp.]MDA3955893.1 PEGA domain-containing protein [Oceanispirochaeta sp.]
MIRKLIPFFLFLISFPAFSQVLDSSMLSIEKETWNVGMSRFTGFNLDKKHEYLLTSLPLLLIENISDIENHQFSEEEKEYYIHQHIDEQIISIEKSKSELHRQRDILLFSEKEKKDRQKLYDDLSLQMTGKEELLSLWENLSPEEIFMQESLPVLIESYADEGNQLIELRSGTQKYMDKEGLDLLLSGSIERVDDLFFLSFSCFNINNKMSLLDISRTAREEEIDSVLLEISDQVRTIILGRTWAGLNVSVTPENALISIDGKTLGVGSLLTKTLLPGFATVQIKTTGFQTQSQQIYLAPERIQSLEVNLTAGESESLFIFSDPPGADVYMGALWIGQTPLFTERPAQLEQLKISKENYMSFFMSTRELLGDSITVELGLTLYDKEKKLKDSKSAFYRALGWFSLSVGVPLILSGIYQNLDNRYYNYAIDYNSTGNPESYDKALEYKNHADIAYYSYWGGVAVSGTLLVNTIFKLRSYIRAAEESTED